MVPINTTVEDIETMLSYLNRQIGWIEIDKIEKALGKKAVDHRKVSAMTALGMINRDNSNVRATERGLKLVSNQADALRESIDDFELYRVSVEWIHYQKLTQVTVAEIGQYWEASHSDTLDGISGETLRQGAVCFGRVLEGAEFGGFFVGRGGKETRIEIDTAAVAAFVDQERRDKANESATSEQVSDSEHPIDVLSEKDHTPTISNYETPVSVSTSPNVHVNVEIHIAADATPETVEHIFRNMARYVLDKPTQDNAN